jgi:DNA-binding NarL/FixJ family response regulator
MLRKFVPKHLHYLFEKNAKEGKSESRLFHFDTTLDAIVKPIPTEAQREHQKKQSEYLSLWYSLSPRQHEVLALVCMGLKNHEIARTLGIEFGTAKIHVQNIIEKFELGDRHAIRLALRDWDFETWWKERHMQPSRPPKITISG